MRTFIVICLFLFLLKPTTYAQDQINPNVIPDSLIRLSRIEGANMIYYTIYSDNIVNDKEKAVKYAEMFLQGIDTSAVYSEIASIHDFLATYYSEEKYMYTKAIDHLLSVAHIQRSLNFQSKLASTNIKLAAHYLNKGQYHKTLTHTIDAMSYYDGIDSEIYDTSEVLECYNLLGIVYSICGDIATSESYFDKYLLGAKQQKDSLKIINALHNRLIANPYDTVASNLLTDEALKISNELQDTVALIQNYLGVARYAIVLGKKADALEVLNEVKPYLSTMSEMGTYHMLLGDIYLASEQQDKAIFHLEEALRWYGDGEFGSEKQFCLNSLQRIYAQNHKYKDAFIKLKEYNDIESSKNSEQVFLELFKTQYNIRKLAQEKDIQSRKLTLLISIIVSILSIIIISLAVLLSLKKKSAGLKVKEMKIKDRNEVLEIKQLQQYHLSQLTDEIIRKIHEVSADTVDVATKKRLESICNDLLSTKEGDSWKNINTFVPEFNTDFFQRLIHDHPELTVNERRLCSLLNLNLSTKEISEITRQSPKSINVARSRLRTKLKISGDHISIQEYLSKFNS